MSNKSWLAVACMAFFLSPAAAEKPADDGSIVFIQMGIEESFVVKLKPDWRVFRRKSVDLCYEDFLIKGPEFYLTMQFCYEDPERLQYDTPEKQREALLTLTSSLYAESHEKVRGRSHAELVRTFSPGGRSGCALRLTAARWIGRTPPREEAEGKFATCGLFKVGANSALFFQLWTNTVDDAAYHELLNLIADLIIPELGESGWELANALKAAKAAEAELRKLYTAEEFAAMRPCNVRRTANGWIVSGSRWDPAPGGSVEIELDGATGKVLRVCRGK